MNVAECLGVDCVSLIYFIMIFLCLAIFCPFPFILLVSVSKRTFHLSFLSHSLTPLTCLYRWFGAFRFWHDTTHSKKQRENRIFSVYLLRKHFAFHERFIMESHLRLRAKPREGIFNKLDAWWLKRKGEETGKWRFVFARRGWSAWNI